jgi:hypothetical protein
VSRAALAALIGLVAGVAIGACTIRRDATPSWQRAHEKKNEITALWTQIRQWRQEADMDLEPSDKMVLAVERMDAGKVRRERLCPAKAPPPACDDVCGLADAICENAESICGIAAELGGDDWADEKCNSAKASCREAKQVCCSCDGREVTTP